MVFDIFDELWLVVSEEDKLPRLTKSPFEETVCPKRMPDDLSNKLDVPVKDTFQCKNSVLPVRRRRPHKVGRMSRRWSELDDIFLTGIVMDTYRRRHSLKPYRGEKGLKRSASKGETLVWQGIHQRYEVARRRYFMLTGRGLRPRSLKALQKRWKLTNRTRENAVDATGCFLHHLPLSKKYEKQWEENYNYDNLLTCPEEQFKIKVGTKK